MKRLLLIAIITMIVVGCIGKSDSREGIINIDLTQKIIPVQKTGIIKQFDVIKLKTPDGVIIGDISKIIVFNNRIYVADYKQTRCVNVFDMEGNLLQTINRRGRGPGEYTNIASVFVDKYQGKFNILNQFPGLLLSWELDGMGNPEATAFKNMSLSDMVAHNNHLIGYTTVSSDGKYNNIYLFDRTGNKVNGQMTLPKGWESNGFGDVNVFSTFNDNIYFKPTYEHIIYRLNKETFEPVYSLDFGSYSWPSEIQSADDYRKSEKDFIKKIYRYQETEGYWMFQLLLNGQDVLALVDKNNRQSTLCSLTPNESPCFISFGRIKSITQNHIVTAVEADRIARTLENEELLRDYPESVKQLKETVGDIQSRDNPVIVIYHLEGSV